MEEILTSLESLKNSLPVNCTMLNVQKLKLKFLEYKYLSGLVPEDYSGIKILAVQKFDLIKSRIDALDDTSTRRAMKMIFQETTGLLKNEIEAMHLKLWLEQAKM